MLQRPVQLYWRKMDNYRMRGVLLLAGQGDGAAKITRLRTDHSPYVEILIMADAYEHIRRFWDTTR